MEEIKSIRISELKDFKNHPFHVQQDMEMCALMKSIEDEGVIVPLLVRPNPDGEGYEVIAGHRRKAAALWAGLTEVPAVIRELDDNQAKVPVIIRYMLEEDAIISMVDANLQRERISPSEKAFAYKMKLEAMNRQGRKADITSAQVGPKPERSNELLAKQVGESVAQIKRYIRLTYLIPKILQMVDEEKIAFTIAVELSYLTEEEQYELHAVMDMEQCTPSLSQANRMKRISQSGGLDMDAMYVILEEEKPNQREQIKIRADKLSQYFPSDYTPKQKVELIEKLVKEWHDHQQQLDVAEKSRKRGNAR